MSHGPSKNCLPRSVRCEVDKGGRSYGSNTRKRMRRSWSAPVAQLMRLWTEVRWSTLSLASSRDQQSA